MNTVHLYQICYSPQTLAGLEPGFTPLDNLSNPRPDWREYWPIRGFLRNSPMQEDGWYGFFSPKFRAKTGLAAEAVRRFVAEQPDDTDVVLFSPFFDQIAFPLNVFEQGAMQHPDTLRTFRDCALAVAPDAAFDALVMDSTNTVFCNFFVARPRFWRDWLAKCEVLFEIAEARATELASKLNGPTTHDGGGVPLKVFVIERVASLMLATDNRWKPGAYNAMSLPWSQSPLTQFRLEMAFLDALKIAYRNQAHPQYLESFHRLRQILSESLQQAQR